MKFEVEAHGVFTTEEVVEFARLFIIENAPGNAWHWAPLDSSRFDLEWGGIDAAMQFTVTRRDSSYTATGQRSSSGPMPGGELQPTVQRGECPR